MVFEKNISVLAHSRGRFRKLKDFGGHFGRKLSGCRKVLGECEVMLEDISEVSVSWHLEVFFDRVKVFLVDY